MWTALPANDNVVMCLLCSVVSALFLPLLLLLLFVTVAAAAAAGAAVPHAAHIICISMRNVCWQCVHVGTALRAPVESLALVGY